MLIIETSTTFEQYLKSLSKVSKKNYKYAQKHNKDLIYKKIPFDRELVRSFMKLWQRQIIRGQRRKWKFGVEYVEELEKQNKLMVFAALDKEIFKAVHFVQLHENYIEAYPPMYDKKYGSKRYLAKWMWFNLIKYAMDNHLSNIDMGGGLYESWRETIKRREEFRIAKYTKYKWLYVPEAVKKNPNLQYDYKFVDGKMA